MEAFRNYVTRDCPKRRDPTIELGKGCADRAALDGGDKLGSAMVADFCGAPYRTLAYVEQIQPVSTVLFT
jgi:hypothetical protein